MFGVHRLIGFITPTLESHMENHTDKKIETGDLWGLHVQQGLVKFSYLGRCSYLWLAGNEEMDPYGSPCITLAFEGWVTDLGSERLSCACAP